MLNILFFKESFRSIGFALFWGALIPLMFFNFANWIDKQYWVDNVPYFFTPLAAPLYCVVLITYFPGLVFLIGFGWIHMPLNAFILISLVINIITHWLLWKFTWKSKLSLTNDVIDINNDSRSSCANIVGYTFVGLTILEFLLFYKNLSLLLSNLGLLALGLYLLVFARNIRKNKSRTQQES